MTSIEQSREEKRTNFLRLVGEVKALIRASIDEDKLTDDVLEIALKYFAESLITEFPPPLKLVEFFIQETTNDLIWIEHKSGVGMMTGKGRLNKVIKKFFNRNS